MFGLSLISTKKLNHLYSEASHLAIENVRLSKDNTKLTVAVAELDKALTAHRLLMARMESALDNIDRQNRYLKRVVGLHGSVKRKKKR